MLLMFEHGIRGGITQAVHRYASANYPYMGDLYNPSEESSYLQYLDANNLYGWDVSEDDCQHAQKVWKEFGIRNLGDYHNLYLRTDVILLANMFETFRDTCLEHYSLDPAHFYTSPGKLV